MITDVENPLYRQYFHWLYNRVCLVTDDDSPAGYMTVCEKMHQLAFKPFVEHDGNRVGDAVQLRTRFLVECGVSLNGYDAEPATVFEVLVALAERANFMSQIGEQSWFITFLRNLELIQFTDRYVRTHSTRRIETILNRFNDRRYMPTGQGGLFPLRQPIHDQRHVEIWYQMAEYMTENRMY